MADATPYLLDLLHESEPTQIRKNLHNLRLDYFDLKNGSDSHYPLSPNKLPTQIRKNLHNLRLDYFDFKHTLSQIWVQIPIIIL